jgi:metal-sulfur cluster biosynthetic enzyme
MTENEAGTATRPTNEELREILRAVEDPELHMSIVDLGLVYGVEIDEDGQVTVDMTLTSPACPVGPMLQGLIFHKLSQVDGVEDVEVNLVWSPPWDPRTMASEDIKMALGIW